MPWHWYFTSALIKSFHFNLFFLFIVCYLACIDFTNQIRKYLNHKELQAEEVELNKNYKMASTCLYYFFPILCFICLYSILPHKEIRFLFPVFPILFLVISIGINILYEKGNNLFPKKRNVMLSKLVTRLGVSSIIIFNLLVSVGFVYISYHNYPGGNALQQFHIYLAGHMKLSSSSSSSSLSSSVVRVHIDPDAAMTGVSRFGELRG